MRFLKSKKILIIAIIIAIAITGGIVGFIFNAQKLPTYKLLIKPTELIPFVSHEQARAKICSTMKGRLFDEVCQQKFDKVSKNNAEKISALFSLLKKIEDDQSISDYERLLLAQAVFASLPTKDSPLTQRSGFHEFLSKLKNGVIGQSVAHAVEAYDSLTTDKEEFKNMMFADLKNVVGNLPEGDNAWIIQVMVSKYRWINGEKQPIYSQVFKESFDPYPGVSTEDKSKWEKFDMTHIQSRVSAYASDQAMYNGPVTEGTGEMIAYSFSMASWKSKPYGSDSVLVVAESGPAQKYLVSRNDYSEENYEGDNLLSDLLRKVKMPDRYSTSDKQDKKPDVSETGVSTEWGSANDDRETAYEAYFWMHLQLPTVYATFWETYGNTEGMGGALRTLPLGEPVNLRDYFNTPGVRDYYEQVRKINASIPTLDEFLGNIDEYQANLNLGKPSESPQTAPVEVEQENKEEDKFETFLRECYNQPIPKTAAEIEAFDRKFSDPNSPCYSETFKP